MKDRFSDAILHAAQSRYGVPVGEIHPLAAIESFIYEFRRGDESYILRLAHSLRFTEPLIAGEIDWINYLAAGGVSVAQAIPSDAGKLVETIDDGQGGQFLVTAFVKAEGQPPHDQWTPTLYATYGELIGQMHALAEHYEPGNPAWRRPDWTIDQDFVEHFLPDSEAVAKQKYAAACAHMRTLPTDRQGYGLIHYDAHPSNMHVDDAGRLTLFDFAECAYCWYAMDIAVALLFMTVEAPDAPALARAFLPEFLRGYRRAYHLDPKWLREIPVFLKAMEIFLYAVNFRDYAEGETTDAWSAAYMRDRKYRIEHDVPYLDVDFQALAAAA